MLIVQVLMLGLAGQLVAHGGRPWRVADNPVDTARPGPRPVAGKPADTVRLEAPDGGEQAEAPLGEVLDANLGRLRKRTILIVDKG